MKDYEQQLEERLDRELKELPELQAPPALAARILSAVSRRAARPWYRRSWQAWPVSLRAASLPILLAMFGGLCWSVSALAHTVASAPATQKIAGELAGLRLIWRTLSVLSDAAILSFRHLGPGFLAAVFIALVLAYVACLALGTLSLRLAMARTDRTQL
jgi:hypothetical protein